MLGEDGDGEAAMFCEGRKDLLRGCQSSDHGPGGEEHAYSRELAQMVLDEDGTELGQVLSAHISPVVYIPGAHGPRVRRARLPEP